MRTPPTPCSGLTTLTSVLCVSIAAFAKARSVGKTTVLVPFKLDEAGQTVTLDYGVERGGWPYFSVRTLGNGPVQIEVKYSESFVGLAQPMSDGPYTYAGGLSNAFRVETFNVTSIGDMSSFLLQGGLRWQSIELLTPGTVEFELVGLEASFDTTEVEDMPGHFECDDELLNEIWKLGARAAEAACLGKGSQRAVWEVDKVEGVRTRSTRPALSLVGNDFSDYTLEFDTMIERGGIWWNVAYPLAFSTGLQLALVSELPEESTYVNTNKTLLRPNSVLLGDGYAFVNQTTLTSYMYDSYDVPFRISEGSWYHVQTVMSPQGWLSVSINDTQIFNTSRASLDGPPAFSGSFGFGAWQDQEAIVRNVVVTDTTNGTVLYRNPMTSADVLAEYGTQANLASVCLDGAKRDRLVWLGDFFHTARSIGASTSRFNLSKGTLDFLLSTQIPGGELNISPAMGYDPSFQAPYMELSPYALQDYQLLGLDAFHSYMRQTNDISWAQETWDQRKLQVNWLLSNVNATDGLVHFVSAFTGAADGGSAPNCLAVQVLKQMADIATLIGDADSAAGWEKTAADITAAINSQLWNDDLGTYATSLANFTDFSVASTAFCITSGVASDLRAARSLTALQALRLGPGYKDSSQDSSADPATNISPNTNGFLLPALLVRGSVNGTAAAVELLRSLWGPMVTNSQWSSGASWEYVTQGGAGGLGLFTSLAHPWGGAPTYVLTEHAAGLRAADGRAGFGYRSWVVDPTAGVLMGLRRAAAQVKTPGGTLAIRWEIKSGRMKVNVKAPRGTQGVFRFNDFRQTLTASSLSAGKLARVLMLFSALSMSSKGTSTLKVVQNQLRKSEATILSTPNRARDFSSSISLTGVSLRLEKRFRMSLRRAA
ncbi:Six-hairpin glycosidase [Xylariaceae sp. FL0804]|nr:Six-hairpin glycosidase [Xylariaceae sp. FL0804]